MPGHAGLTSFNGHPCAPSASDGARNSPEAANEGVLKVTEDTPKVRRLFFLGFGLIPSRLFCATTCHTSGDAEGCLLFVAFGAFFQCLDLFIILQMFIFIRVVFFLDVVSAIISAVLSSCVRRVSCIFQGPSTGRKRLRVGILPVVTMKTVGPAPTPSHSLCDGVSTFHLL